MKNAIKGLAIRRLVDDLRALVNDGDFSEAEIGKHLEAGDLALLEGEFDPFSWVPIESYERLQNALRDWNGNEGTVWLHERGAAAARRLIEGGLYQQLDALQEGHPWAKAPSLARIRLIATLNDSLLNFSKWKVETDPDHEQRLRIVVTEAAAYPEMLRHVTEGFINACDVAAGGAHRWHSERIAPDCIVFSMDSDL